MKAENKPASPKEEWFKRSALYREYLAEREEILKHKWIESENARRDVGCEGALVSWVVHRRAQWQKERRSSPGPGPA